MRNQGNAEATPEPPRLNPNSEARYTGARLEDEETPVDAHVTPRQRGELRVHPSRQIEPARRRHRRRCRRIRRGPDLSEDASSEDASSNEPPADGDSASSSPRPRRLPRPLRRHRKRGVPDHRPHQPNPTEREEHGLPSRGGDEAPREEEAKRGSAVERPKDERERASSTISRNRGCDGGGGGGHRAPARRTEQCARDDERDDWVGGEGAGGDESDGDGPESETDEEDARASDGVAATPPIICVSP